MIGYKGIELRNGILRANCNVEKSKDIFEIGVPKQIIKIDDGIAFSENGYSFCGTIEAVLNWMDYLTPKGDRKTYDVRLFEIDTLDSDTLGGTEHYKAKQIVVNREISPQEIIQYFRKYPEKLPSEEMRIQFNKYCIDHPHPYKFIKDTNEIKKLMIQNCLRFKQASMCVQNDESTDIDKCKHCRGYDIVGGISEVDYNYLIARSKLYDGIELSTIKEYNKSLKDNLVERQNLDLLATWIKNNVLK